MTDENLEAIVELLSEQIEVAKRTDVKSEEHAKAMNDIRTLTEILQDNDKINLEEARIRFEDSRNDEELEMKKKYSLWDRINESLRNGIPIIVAGIALAGNAYMQTRSFDFETEGTYSATGSKAWKWLQFPRV